MKKLNLFSIIILAIIFITSSCSIEKRHYTSGYNIEWKSNKIKSVAVNKDKQSQKVIAKKQETKSIDQKLKEKELNIIIASSDNSQIIIPQKEKIDFHSTSIIADPVKYIVEKITQLPDKSKSSQQQQSDNINILALLSFIFGAIGFLFVILSFTGISGAVEIMGITLLGGILFCIDRKSVV